MNVTASNYMAQQEIVKISEGFDGALWKAGVADGAFAGLRDPAARWFSLEVDGKKLALASAVPGPGELTSVSYFVVNEARGRGYATVLASSVCDRFEKASFLVMKDNDASVKVALNALRDKFSMVMGHNAVRLTKEAVDPGLLVGIVGAAGMGAYLGRKLIKRVFGKKADDQISGGKADKKKPEDFNAAALAEGQKHELEHTSDPAIAKEIAMDHLAEDPGYYEKLKKIEKKAADDRNTVGTTLEGKIHEGFTVTADKMYQAGMMSTKERIALSGAIGDMLGQFRKKVNRDVASRTMTDRAHDLLKSAVSERRFRVARLARLFAKRHVSDSTGGHPGHVEMAYRDRGRELAKFKTTQMTPAEREKAMAMMRSDREFAIAGKDVAPKPPAIAVSLARAKLEANIPKDASERAAYVAMRARQLAQGAKPSGYRISEVARVAQKTSPSPMTAELRKEVAKAVRFVQKTTKRTMDTNEIAKAIRKRIDPQEGMF
jgi:hypothetical protein